MLRRTALGPHRQDLQSCTAVPEDCGHHGWGKREIMTRGGGSTIYWSKGGVKCGSSLKRRVALCIHRAENMSCNYHLLLTCPPSIINLHINLSLRIPSASISTEEALTVWLLAKGVSVSETSCSYLSGSMGAHRERKFRCMYCPETLFSFS